jgi:hypothetical protein
MAGEPYPDEKSGQAVIVSHHTACPAFFAGALLVQSLKYEYFSDLPTVSAKKTGFPTNNKNSQALPDKKGSV